MALRVFAPAVFQPDVFQVGSGTTRGGTVVLTRITFSGTATIRIETIPDTPTIRQPGGSP